MKKIFALILTLVLVFAFSATAFATEVKEDKTLPAENGKWIITKTYKLAGAGTSPAETFALTVTPATGSPKGGVTIAGAQFAAGAANANGATANFAVSVDITKFSVPGVYEFTVKEDDTATPGVAYDETEYTLKVTVVNDTATTAQPGDLVVAAVSLNKGNEKVNDITNTYSANSLSISKQVTGNLGDKTKYFEFTVTFSDTTTAFNVKTGSANGTGTDTAKTTVKSGDTIYLKHGDTLTIENIPAGVTYEVTETAVENYETTPTNRIVDGTISASAEAKAEFVNKYDTEVDTGISLDSLPYILLLVAVAAVLVVMVIRKRRAIED